MAAPYRRRLLPALLAVIAAALFVPAASACPFCTMQGQTLTQEVEQASMVLYGTLANAKLDAAGDGGGTTELVVEAVIKRHDILSDKKVVVLPRYVPTDKDTKFLVFCDVFKGKIDPYRGVAVKADSDIVKYLQGALKVKDKDISGRLRFYFDYLDNADVEVSNDAYKEFGNADYKDFGAMAKELPAEKVAGWLQDKETPAFRYGLYASILGHSGKPEHAEVLRKMLDDPDKRAGSGIDGLLAGYTMLKPKEGWEYTRAILGNAKKEFMFRYAALRAARFFWENRPEVVGKEKLIDGVCLLLDDGNIADLAIEDLRKWGRWEVTDRVLGLFGKESHNVPIVKRSILRFALSVPNNAKAEAFVKEMKKKDAEWVSDVEELLKLEATPIPPPPVVEKK